MLYDEAYVHIGMTKRRSQMNERSVQVLTTSSGPTKQDMVSSDFGAPNEAACFSALPSELLIIILHAVEPHHGRADGRKLPALALASSALLAVATNGPHALRCDHLRIQGGLEVWNSVLCDAPRPPAVIDLRACDTPGPALLAWARAAAAKREPIRGLALTKCYRLTPQHLLPTLEHVPSLVALVFTSHRLAPAAMEKVGMLTELRLLCLAESTIEASSLMACLRRLRALRCLLLGGASLLRRSTAEPAFPAFASVDGEGSDEVVSGERAGGCCMPQLALLEVTFLSAADQETLHAASPGATLLDCCSDGVTLGRGLRRLRGLLLDDARTACDGVRCVAEAAVRAALSARWEACCGQSSSGGGETALHHAAIERHALRDGCRLP